MRRKLFLGGLFLVILILALVWMQGGFHRKVPAGRTVPEDRASDDLRTTEVAASLSKGEVTVTGTVAARETARIAARLQGFVVELNVDAGTKVKKDDVLLRIDARELNEQVAQAEAQLNTARANAAESERDLHRYEKLHGEHAVSQQQFDRARTAYDVARASVRQAEGRLQETRALLSYTVVTAPFDGIVGERQVNVGDMVAPGQYLLNVFRPGTVELAAAVGEQYAESVKENTPVVVDIPSLGLRQETKIREVVPIREEKSRTITVKAPLPDQPGLQPGLYGTLTFDTGDVEVVLIPKTALRTVGQLESVRVAENGEVKTRHVKTGRTRNGSIEILSGLKPGEKLVVE
ncbi:MAG: efflux RND transporter periplasmic adaptor subunit [Desulfomonilaceae bacterium]|nr:efflux RND transporter periplasmic adaptor subunit [Desulfomonilaceae bacterium]